MTAIKPGRSLIDAKLSGDPTAPTPTAGDDDTSVATTGFVTTAITTAVAGISTERAILLGKGGIIASTDADAADFPISVPFNCTALRMKIAMKAGPSGAMVVKLRKAAAPVTTAPSYSDVTGFTATFTASNVTAIVDPANQDLSEGDFLNFSCTTGGGTNLVCEVIVVPR